MPQFGKSWLALVAVLLVACGNNEITMKSYTCTSDGKTPSDYIRYKFTVQGSKVFSTATDMHSGKEGKSSISELEKCAVIDGKNWQCGGVPYESFLVPNAMTEKFQVVDGKFKHTPGGITGTITPAPGCESYLTWKSDGLFQFLLN